jgi:hypothetical protein
MPGKIRCTRLMNRRDLQILPIVIQTMFEIRKTLRCLKDNPVSPKRLADTGLFSEINIEIPSMINL